MLDLEVRFSWFKNRFPYLDFRSFNCGTQSLFWGTAQRVKIKLQFWLPCWLHCILAKRADLIFVSSFSLPVTFKVLSNNRGLIPCLHGGTFRRTSLRWVCSPSTCPELENPTCCISSGLTPEQTWDRTKEGTVRRTLL